MNYPFLSIVIPVRNEERHISGVLEQLLNQDYPQERLEIIVVDGNSQDRTRELVSDFAKRYSLIRLSDNSKLLSSAARNIGVEKSKGEIIVYLDGHCQIPSPDLLKNIVSAFEKSGADCLGRAQPLVAGEKKMAQAIALARSSVLGHNPNSYIYSDFEGLIDPTSCGAVYKKEIFQKVGFFDESFDACEDVEFNLRVKRAGLKCYLSPGLRIQYFPRESLSNLFRQMFRYGWGRFKLLQKYPGTVSLFTMLPGLYLLALLTLFLISLFHSSFLWMLLALTLVYSIPIAVFSLALSKKSNLSLFPLLLLIFPTIHFGTSLGFWSGLLVSPKRK